MRLARDTISFYSFSLFRTEIQLVSNVRDFSNKSLQKNRIEIGEKGLNNSKKRKRAGEK